MRECFVVRRFIPIFLPLFLLRSSSFLCRIGARGRLSYVVVDAVGRCGAEWRRFARHGSAIPGYFVGRWSRGGGHASPAARNEQLGEKKRASAGEYNRRKGEDIHRFFRFIPSATKINAETLRCVDMIQ